MVPIFVVDAFITDIPFSGNPAGICLLDSWKNDTWMQQVASEMKHSETAFLVKKDSGFGIRYFTPTTEIPLCGHATLASAYVLWKENIVSQHEDITFYAKGGDLTAKFLNNTTLALDFPTASSEKLVLLDNKIIKNLAIAPLNIYQSHQHIIFELPTENDIVNYIPDFDYMKTLPYRMIVITSKSKKPDIDFVSRIFAPTLGIKEDPATGVAHCILGPLWMKKLHKSELTAYQASSRGANFTLRVNETRIQLSGEAKLMVKGHFYS